MKIGNSGHTRGGRPFPRIDRNQNESRINSEYNPSIQKWNREIAQHTPNRNENRHTEYERML